MTFDFNKIYKEINDTFPVKLNGEKKNIEGYSLLYNRQTLIPEYMDMGKGVGVYDIGDGIGCFAFNVKDFFSKIKYINHNNIKEIHPDYFHDDINNINYISDIVGKTGGFELLDFIKYENRIFSKKTKELNDYLKQQKDNIFVSIIDYDGGLALVKPGSLIKEIQNNKDDLFIFAFYDDKGFFTLNNNNEKIRGDFFISNSIIKSINNGESLMSGIKKQLSLMSEIQENVNFQSNEVELASLINEENKKMSNFYKLLRDPKNKDMFRKNFRRDFDNLLVGKGYNEEKAKVNLSEVIINEITSDVINNSNVSDKNKKVLKEICKVDKEKLNIIRLDIGWKEYFTEELNELEKNIDGSVDFQERSKYLIDLVKLNSEFFNVLTTEFRDFKNEIFPNAEKIDVFNKKINNLNEKINNYFIKSNTMINENNTIIEIGKKLSKQIEVISNIKNNSLYKFHHEKTFNIPEFNKKEDLKYKNISSKFQTSVTGKIVGRSVEKFPKIMKNAGKIKSLFPF